MQAVVAACMIVPRSPAAALLPFLFLLLTVPGITPNGSRQAMAGRFAGRGNQPISPASCDPVFQCPVCFPASRR